jgi:hypothetical protein
VQDEIDTELARKRAERALLPKKPPLFLVQLVVGANNEVQISPSAAEIESVLLEAVASMLGSLKRFKRMDNELMSLLHLDERWLFDLGNGGPAAASVAECQRAIKAIVAKAMVRPTKLANEFDNFVDIMSIDVDAFVDNFMAREPAPTVSEMFDETQRLHFIMESVPKLSYTEELFRLVLVDTSDIQQKLFNKAKQLRDALLTKLVDDARAESESVVERYQAIQNRLRIKPKDEYELKDLKEFMEASNEMVESLTAEVTTIHSKLDGLGDFGTRLSESDFQLAWGCKEWPNRLLEDQEAAMD